MLFFFKLDTHNVYMYLNSYWHNNNVLTNSLSLIHPILVYVLYVNTIWLIKSNFFDFFKIKSMVTNSFKIAFFALILGS